MIAMNDACRGWGAKFCDVEVPTERLRSFLATGVPYFLRMDVVGRGERLSEAMRQDVRCAAAIAAEIGVVPPTNEQRPAVTRNNLAEWSGQVRAGRPLIGEIVARPLAEAIIKIGAASEAVDSASEQIEVLLRQVEVRRLSTAVVGRGDPARLLVADVALFLARCARSCGDIRLLNSAFKINDREFDQHRRYPLRESTTRYLVAIAEQERAAEELLT